MSPRPLFVTAVARSGSTLLCRMLQAHRQVACASDPYLPLMRTLRNRLVQDATSRGEHFAFDPAWPLQDYYFTDDRIRMMDAIQSGSLDAIIDQQSLIDLRTQCALRAAAESGDLIAHLGGLRGDTCAELAESALGIVCAARNAHDNAWAGFKEVWTIEMIAPLARAFPRAKFIVLLRDPRGVLASIHALGRQDAGQRGHPLSYARHWRKYAAFCRHYQQSPELAPRIHVMTYEQLVGDPEAAASALCDFLEIPIDGSMLEPSKYMDYATGLPWRGNSSFLRNQHGIMRETVSRWQTELPQAAAAMISLVCGPDMRLLSYDDQAGNSAAPDAARIQDYFATTSSQPCSWRSDLGDPRLDCECEFARRSMLEAPDGRWEESMIRRAFLFPSVFEALRGLEAAACAATGAR